MSEKSCTKTEGQTKYEIIQNVNSVNRVQQKVLTISSLCTQRVFSHKCEQLSLVTVVCGLIPGLGHHRLSTQLRFDPHGANDGTISRDDPIEHIWAKTGPRATSDHWQHFCSPQSA